MSAAEAFPLRLRGESASESAACAVVLVRIEGAQFHLGLRRGDEAHEPVLHLGWHRRLKDEALARVIEIDQQVLPSAVIVLALDPSLDEVLQVLARRVARRYANQSSPLSYGFGEASAEFARGTGELTEADAAFTCATFVLALLRSVGLRILDGERWRPPTEEDLRWQRDTGKLLLEWIERRIHGDLPRAKERVEQDIGSRRYRPTDVAGAALYSPAKWPAGAEDVAPRAHELESALSRVSSAA